MPDNWLPVSVVDALSPPAHGADLAAASLRYGIPVADWLDLSTGINPRAYPLRDIDAELFQHLPFDDAALRRAAKKYCGAPGLPVAAAGSQVLIQWLPLLRAQMLQCRSRVGVPSIGYSEHAFRWRWAGHEIVFYDPRSPVAIDDLLKNDNIDVLIVINAHNPLGSITSAQQLLAWHTTLANSGGWLIVDEAFIDPTPQHSVAALTQLPGLIVLRSLGKFFGLAGVRCGFAFCADTLAEHLAVAVGPWAVAGPTQSLATAALHDTGWQQRMRSELMGIAAANVEWLQSLDWASGKTINQHVLFNSIELSPQQAVAIEDCLASRGIRVRRIEIDARSSLLRFGLIDNRDNDRWARRLDMAAQK
jgi:cobalamin biosynthesis protein CobC